jgi:4-hydroxy-tetrahydrodipicolinate synthase
MSKFKGTGVAVITPFFKDFSVDYNSLTKIINHLIENGIEYLVALGSTAEAATLNEDEKTKIAAHFVKVNQGRVPLVIGVGGNNTMAVVEELKTRDFSGYDAILSVSPAYNKPTQEGLYQHFKAISEASSLPILLYNVPGRTGKNVDPKTVIRLAHDFKNIIGIKEAAGEMTQALELLRTKPADFDIISGDDMIALPMTLAGGAGVISVIGQGLPREFSEMIRLGLAGKAKEAYDIQYKIMPSIDMIFAEGNPGGIKSMMEQQGWCENVLRLPLVPISETLHKQIGAFIKNL